MKQPDRNRPIRVMGIVNITDDSFYADSRMLEAGAVASDRLVGRVGAMLDEGADLIDIGACSTRPGSSGVGAEEEWRRLEPALQALRSVFPTLSFSVDTYWSEVVRRCYDRFGPFTVNDITAGMADPAMLPLTGKLGLPYIAMHMRGMPADMQLLTDYPDGVTGAVAAYFDEFAVRAEEAGVTDWILDPGFGFAKTVEQNWTLVRELPALLRFGRPLLVGVSRKSMLTRPLGITPAEALPATTALHLALLQNGADILRVHDVAEAVRTVSIYRML